MGAQLLNSATPSATPSRFPPFPRLTAGGAIGMAAMSGRRIETARPKRALQKDRSALEAGACRHTDIRFRRCSARADGMNRAAKPSPSYPETWARRCLRNSAQ
jgi:hypothetical protein